jgi:hypothetical protein
VISLFGCILCCKAPALCLFSIVAVFAVVLDVVAVPYLSSNVPFPMHDFKWVFHFYFQADHGFRKFFKTHAEQVMKPINVEVLMSHSTGVSDSYYNQLKRSFLKTI